ncbi:hypothetical protein J1N35_030899 [Gossypium stocksii]|uniref:Major facilitator superfamily (MFS) profile domain-containing protein n=1 Tax=Gossypium stocksii TaxID=47602 RepID=A0A9D3V0L6_9ROSI|nr:hypothetical protein J1N35_030899 [Gossypium stocksii]
MQKLKGAFGNMVVRRGLYVGVTVQVAQQFSGINTVMHYSPMIVRFVRFASNKTAMALSLVTSGLNALGSVVSMFFVDRYDRRKMMLISMMGIITFLLALTVVFWQAAIWSPQLNRLESTEFGVNAMCPSFKSVADTPSWNCMSCLKAECGFCTNALNKRSLWRAGRSFQLGPNLIGSESFLTLTKAFGSAGTFLLFTGFSVIGIICIYVFVPETKGLSFEEVENLLETGFKPKAFRKKKSKE